MHHLGAKAHQRKEIRLVAVLIVMPNLKSKKIQQIIRCLEVGKHTIEVNSKHWTKRIKTIAPSHPVLRSSGKYPISRKQLLRMPNSRASDKCLAILMWGYPSGGRGKNITRAIRNLPNIAAAASTPRPTWRAYYKSFARGWGVNASTITKFAYFFGHKFAGDKALVLDLQIARTFDSKRWSHAPHPVGSYPWINSYPVYLREMRRLANAIGAKPDQLELFLYLLGPHFR